MSDEKMSDEKDWRGIEQSLRRPPERDVEAEARVLERIATLPPHRPPLAARVWTWFTAPRLMRVTAPAARVWAWLVAPRLVRVTPLAGLAAVSLAVIAGWLLVRDTPPDPRIAPPSTMATASGLQPVRFSLVAPQASQVSVVGDFNNWSTATHAMRATEGGLWSITVALPPGRHTYAFLVDGTLWLADEHAPRAPEDEFGRESSVVLVRTGGVS